MFLIQLFADVGFKKRQLVVLNRCWLCLRVLRLSDLTDRSGDQIAKDLCKGQKRLSNNTGYDRPEQGNPNKVAWQLLRKAIRKAFPSKNQKLLLPLGSWVDRKQYLWCWFLSIDGLHLHQRHEESEIIFFRRFHH